MELSNVEEAFKRKKSRVQWLALGDQNAKFFHKDIASGRMSNKILSLCNEQGQRTDDPTAVKEEILGFYKKLSGTKLHRKWMLLTQ